MQLRQLTPSEIQSFSQRPHVKRVAVENFLGSLGDMSYQEALSNIEQDKRSYGWNHETSAAIHEGVLLAFKR